ncbi:DUF6069 family protein [Streptosporangium sp. NPDC020145]|uniref:DUF6069 family protein n=1 Tax=Streptosporangium jomthongense TaxID=1193683 RepID=A0ABV8F2Z3_9ACTN
MNISGGRHLSTVLVAPVAALAVWILAVPVSGTRVTVRMGEETQTLGPVPVVVAGLVAGLAGWALLALLRRRVSRPRRTWTIVAVTVWLLSFLGPLGSSAGGGTMLVLLLMHLVVGAVIVVGLGRAPGEERG